MSEPTADLPTGTVTFLFSDIEGSTRLAHELDVPQYRELLEQQQRLLRAAFRTHGGVERGTEGDSFFVVFRDAPSAVAAAVEAQRSLAAARWPRDVDVRVRMGLHTGEGVQGGDDYVGLDVNRAARIASLAHGGQVLVSDATRALSGRALPEGVTIRDAGEHRIKGFDLPERIYRLTIDGLPSEFPPLRSLHDGESQLRERLTSFVGRRPDLDALRRLLADNRLITLVGAGGTGKTSLAIELAREVEADFTDGAWFVALESVSDPGLMGSAIASALGLRDLSGRTVRDQLQENLSERSLLLVLDNFEQLLESASLVSDLLAAAPAIRFLVTSRAPLHLSGEQVYRVSPLPVPAPGSDEVAQLELVPSVQLFVDRARRVQPSFELTFDNAAAIADICRRLDGLPLGIELAAARIALLGARGIRDRLAKRGELTAVLRGVPNRQRTLRDAIAWSHDLLDSPARALFRRLSIFAGGCRLTEAETVCGPASELGHEVLDVMTELVDQSLVIASERSGEVRFEMFQTVREYATDRLAEDGDRSELQRRHAHAYTDLAEAASKELNGRGFRNALDRLAAERDNLRTVVQWSIDQPEPQTGLRLAASLARFWQLRGEMEEGRSAISALLSNPGAGAPTVARMRALEGAGLLYFYGGENDLATEMYRTQLALARELGDLQGVADARFNLTFTREVGGRTTEALADIDEVTELYRDLGDEQSLARAMWVRANVLREDGRQAEAKDLLVRAVTRLHELGDVLYEASAAGTLSVACLQTGDLVGAARWLTVSLVTADEMGDVAAIAIGLPAMAIVVFELVSPEAAGMILGAYQALSRRYGVWMPRALEEHVKRMDPIGRIRAALDPADFDAALRRGRDMTVRDLVTFMSETASTAGAGYQSSDVVPGSDISLVGPDGRPDVHAG